MLKLQLQDIVKTYPSTETVTALRGITLGFRDHEFVAVLGPSGSGKTTLLNVIGGLDHYDSGDLLINGVSTRQFKDADWDAYRNRSIGFVFQTYNLIGHQSVLQNVEIALTLSGVPAAERRQRAAQALEAVGLADQQKKRPNQLSGGQMQRVAIARALVNNPDIILADEPTGALDSTNSVQLMHILQEIARDRLVIMVTHNAELARQYASRTVTMLDGQICSDDNPPEPEAAVGQPAAAAAAAPKFRKTAMSLTTAAGLSFRNLLTKRGRTLITAFAGSIGIIGVALVLAISNGLAIYMNSMQTNLLSGYPITISTTEQNVDFAARASNNPLMGNNRPGGQQYPTGNVLYAYDSAANTRTHTNVLTTDYLNYVAAIQTALPGQVNNISYTSGVSLNVLAKGADSVVQFTTGASRGGLGALMGGGGSGGGGGSSYWQELPASADFILSAYDLIGAGSRLPTNKNEVVLVVNEYNQVDQAFLEKLGITSSVTNYQLTDFIGKTLLAVIPNDQYYSASDGLYTAASPSQYTDLYASDQAIPLTITGILRVRSDASSSFLSEGIAYTPELTSYMTNNANHSAIAQAQQNSTTNVLTGAPFASDAARTQALQSLGADTTPTAIAIYPKDYAAKDQIKNYLDAYNSGKVTGDQVVYSDLAETFTTATTTLLNTVTLVLVAFAAISLFVSSIMIGIITYVSVLERTKEIGILRSVGARKKDISRVFNAETLIIGLAAGLLGVVLAYLLCLPINGLIANMLGISNIANLPILAAVALVLGSMLLTLIAGLAPARLAAKKDPVAALRTE